jgi:predicted CoA-binding protein
VDLCALLSNTKRIAVLDIKTEEHAWQPAFYVPKYMQDAGFEIVPVPVYYPEVAEILQQPIYRKLVDVPGPVDVVNVFRRPTDLEAHEADIVAKAPRCVWFQLGIRHDGMAERLRARGIVVVQDACIMVEHRKCAR